MSPDYLALKLKRAGLPVPESVAFAATQARRAKRKPATRPQGRPRKDGPRWPNGRLKPEKRPGTRKPGRPRKAAALREGAGGHSPVAKPQPKGDQ